MLMGHEVTLETHDRNGLGEIANCNWGTRLIDHSDMCRRSFIDSHCPTVDRICTLRPGHTPGCAQPASNYYERDEQRGLPSPSPWAPTPTEIPDIEDPRLTAFQAINEALDEAMASEQSMELWDERKLLEAVAVFRGLAQMGDWTD